MSKLRICLGLLTGLVLVYDGYCYGSRHGAFSHDFFPLQNGLASWYGLEHQGERTANGEIFDRNKFTAAHRHLPFNTIVRVTNRENGRSVDVRVNDRGPFTKNRVLDLSEAAAKALDMKKAGVVPVQIQVAQPDAAPSPGMVAP